MKGTMKGTKGVLCTLVSAILLASCNMSNTAKGGLIGSTAGGAAGAGLGAAIGALIGGSKGAKVGASIGAGVGVAGGTTAGVLIGKKMDKAKAAAEAALEDATVETTTDTNGLEAVKVTLDNGILFKVGKSNLQSAAQSSLKKFATNVLNVYTDCDVAIYGYASSDGSDATNMALSQSRAAAVKAYLTTSCGVSEGQIKSTTGFGETPEYLVLDANGKEDKEASRRVEIYLYASEAMINAANAGTLQ